LWERLIAVEMENLSQQVSGKDEVMNILNRLGLPCLRSIRRAVRAACVVLVAVALTLPSMTARAAIVQLVEDSRPSAVLVLSEEASQSTIEQDWTRRQRIPIDTISDEKLAAEEIQTHIEKISGIQLEIVTTGEPLDDRLPVFIGSAADRALVEDIRKRSDDPGSFALVVGDKGIMVRGLSPSGTLFGAYELLEQTGVRWFMPGELGLVIPQSDTVQIKKQRTIQVPSFNARRLQGVRALRWERRMRLGGPYFPASHGVPGFGRRESKELFAQHPEYFSLIDGQRKARQLCLSNPEVLRIAVAATREYFRSHPEMDIMGIGANDGRGFCECENCRALDSGDYDPFGHSPSMTDRYIRFFNQIIEEIKDEFPDKRLGFYAYSVYNRPPLKVIPNPRLVPAIALITLCRLHGMDNPICPEKSYEQWIIREWGKLVPEVYYRGYWFNLADPGLPFFMIERIKRDIPLGEQLGIAGWRVEAPYEWAASAPSRYIACKLMWDHTADVATLMQDFYEKFFGPAARPMHRYVELMSEALSGADYHTGSSWDMPHIYNPAIRAEARKALQEAAGLVSDSTYQKRVWMYTQSLDYLDAFVMMLESRAAHDFVTSKRALDQVNAIREQLLSNDPPLIGRHAESYMNRFFSRTTLEGYECVSGGNQFIVGLDDTWMFQIDPERVGEAIGWWQPENVGGNWRQIRTSTSSWSDQGLRYYKGLAWYRQMVKIPAEYAGRRIFLWVGGIDELAKVWINGKVLGISPKGSFTPFELDATEAIRPGQPNTIVICVSNITLNEVGTGGITGPVMFYAPKGGKDAKPRNAKLPYPLFPEY